MDRAPVAISILLAAAASFAAEPPSSAPAVATEAAAVPAPVEPLDSVAAAAPAAAPTLSPEAPAAPTSAEAALAGHGDETRPAADATPATVPTVDIKKITDDTVCRKERPTGSQISVTRCYSRSAAVLRDDEIMRRDIDEMRARQNEQQAREAASAMRRRPVVP